MTPLHEQVVAIHERMRLAEEEVGRLRRIVAQYEQPINRDVPGERCPVCGGRVRIVGSDEGTLHYEPMCDQENNWSSFG